MKKILLLIGTLLALTMDVDAQSYIDSIWSNLYNDIPADSFVADIHYKHLKSVSKISRNDNSIIVIRLDTKGRIVYYTNGKNAYADSFVYRDANSTLLAKRYHILKGFIKSHLEYSYGESLQQSTYEVNKYGEKKMQSYQRFKFNGDTSRFFTYYADGHVDLLENITKYCNNRNYFITPSDSSGEFFQKAIVVYSTIVHYDTSGREVKEQSKYKIYERGSWNGGYENTLVEKGLLLESEDEKLNDIIKEMVLSERLGLHVYHDIEQLRASKQDTFWQILSRYNIPIYRTELKHAVNCRRAYNKANGGRIISLTKDHYNYDFQYNNHNRISEVVDKSNNINMVLIYSNKGLLSRIEFPSKPEDNVEYKYTYFK